MTKKQANRCNFRNLLPILLSQLSIALVPSTSSKPKWKEKDPKKTERQKKQKGNKKPERKKLSDGRGLNKKKLTVPWARG